MDFSTVIYLLVSLTCLTKSMEQTSSEEHSRFSASQKMPYILWNLKVHYYVYKSSPILLVLRQTNPFHTFPLYFLRIHFNIIITLIPKSTKFFLSLRTSNQNPICISPLPYACHMIFPSRLPWFYQPNDIFSSCSLVPPDVIPPSSLQISFWPPNSWTLSANLSHILWEGNFCTHIKQQTKLYIFSTQTVKRNIVNCIAASILWI